MLPHALFVWRPVFVVVGGGGVLPEQTVQIAEIIATQKITLYIKNNRKLDHLWWIFTFMHVDRLL